MSLSTPAAAQPPNTNVADRKRKPPTSPPRQTGSAAPQLSARPPAKRPRIASPPSGPESDTASLKAVAARFSFGLLQQTYPRSFSPPLVRPLPNERDGDLPAVMCFANSLFQAMLNNQIMCHFFVEMAVAIHGLNDTSLALVYHAAPLLLLVCQFVSDYVTGAATLNVRPIVAHLINSGQWSGASMRRHQCSFEFFVNLFGQLDRELMSLECVFRLFEGSFPLTPIPLIFFGRPHERELSNANSTLWLGLQVQHSCERLAFSLSELIQQKLGDSPGELLDLANPLLVVHIVRSSPDRRSGMLPRLEIDQVLASSQVGVCDDPSISIRYFDYGLESVVFYAGDGSAGHYVVCVPHQVDGMTGWLRLDDHHAPYFMDSLSEMDPCWEPAVVVYQRIDPHGVLWNYGTRSVHDLFVNGGSLTDRLSSFTRAQSDLDLGSSRDLAITAAGVAAAAAAAGVAAPARNSDVAGTSPSIGTGAALGAKDVDKGLVDSGRAWSRDILTGGVKKGSWALLLAAAAAAHGDIPSVYAGPLPEEVELLVAQENPTRNDRLVTSGGLQEFNSPQFAKSIATVRADRDWELFELPTRSILKCFGVLSSIHIANRYKPANHSSFPDALIISTNPQFAIPLAAFGPSVAELIPTSLPRRTLKAKGRKTGAAASDANVDEDPYAEARVAAQQRFLRALRSEGIMTIPPLSDPPNGCGLSSGYQAITMDSLVTVLTKLGIDAIWFQNFGNKGELSSSYLGFFRENAEALGLRSVTGVSGNGCSLGYSVICPDIVRFQLSEYGFTTHPTLDPDDPGFGWLSGTVWLPRSGKLSDARARRGCVKAEVCIYTRLEHAIKAILTTGLPSSALSAAGRIRDIRHLLEAIKANPDEFGGYRVEVKVQGVPSPVEVFDLLSVNGLWMQFESAAATDGLPFECHRQWYRLLEIAAASHAKAGDDEDKVAGTVGKVGTAASSDSASDEWHSPLSPLRDLKHLARESCHIDASKYSLSVRLSPVMDYVRRAEQALDAFTHFFSVTSQRRGVKFLGHGDNYRFWFDLCALLGHNLYTTWRPKKVLTKQSMVVYWFDGDHGNCWPLDPLMILEKGQMLPEPTPPIHPAHLDFCGHKPPSVEIPLLNAGDAGYVAVVDSDPVACKEIRADAYVQAKTLARDGLYCPHGFLSFDEWVREMLRYARCRRCDEAAVIDWHEKCAKLALTGAAMPAGPRFAIHARMHQLRHGHVECRNHERHKTSKSRSMSWYQVFDWLWAVWIHHFKCPYRIDDERPSVSSPPAPTVKKVRKATTPAALRGLAASAIIDFTSRHLRSRPGQAGHESETELHPHSGFKDSDYQPGEDGVTGDSSSSDDEEQVHAQPFVRRTDAPTKQTSSSVPLARPPIQPNPTSAPTARSPSILSPPASQRPHAGTPKATRHQRAGADIAGAPAPLAPSVLRPPPTPHQPPPSASTARPASVLAPSCAPLTMQSTEPQPPPACLPNKPVQSLDTAVARISDAEKRSEAEGLEKAAFFLDKWPASSPRAGARHVFAKKLIPRVRCFDCDAAAIQKWIENGRVGEPEWHSTSRLYSSGRGFKCNNPEAGHGQLDPHRALEAIWQAWLDCLGCPYRRSSPRDSDDDADG